MRILERDDLEHRLPASTCWRSLRVAVSIILGDRSIAVIVPVVSLSLTSETATP